MDVILADLARGLGPLFGAALGVLVFILGAIPAGVSWVARGCFWIVEPIGLATLSVIRAVLFLAISPFYIPWRLATVVYEVWMDMYDEMKVRTLLRPTPPFPLPNPLKHT